MTAEREHRREFENLFLRRAQAAIDAAERIRARSEVIVGLSSAVRQAGMTTRCAWCSRYRISGRWLLPTDAPHFVDFAAVSHGICEDCIAELRAAGLSA